MDQQVDLPKLASRVRSRRHPRPAREGPADRRGRRDQLRHEDLAARLTELHGQGNAGLSRGVRAGTDIYLDAAGVGVVIDSVSSLAKHGATLGIVAVHKKPVPVDFGAILTAELNIVMSMGYPTEIFEVTDDIVANWEKYALIISDRLPFERAQEALALAATPGAADKVTVVFD